MILGGKAKIGFSGGKKYEIKDFSVFNYSKKKSLLPSYPPTLVARLFSR